MWVKKNRTMFIGFAAVFVCFVTGGCRTIGPNTIEDARFDYTDAISSSWKKQMLLNLVKIRYGDTPVFLDVSSIINQYALETELNGGLSWNAFLPTDSQNVSVRSRYSDRPTITYNPMTGEKLHAACLHPSPQRPFSPSSRVVGRLIASYRSVSSRSMASIIMPVMRRSHERLIQTSIILSPG